jgi:hypothetical protein
MDKYCFLEILHKKDRDCFVQLMQCNHNAEFTEMCITGTINIQLYFTILRQIKLENSYQFYRRAYWGENNFNSKITPLKSKKFCLIAYFNSAKTSSNIMDNLSYVISETMIQFGYGASQNKFLIDDNCIRAFANGEFHLSNWTNPDYLLQDPYIIYNNNNSKKSI